MSSNYFKHDTAIVSDDANVGDGSKIWHFCHVMNAKIGSNCVLGQNVFIANRVIIGDGVKIQNNVSVYTGVECEDDVFLGPSMVFTNVINPRSFIERKEEFKKTLIKKGASIGANATVLCGVSIGKFAMIGAGAVVTKNVNDFEIIKGNPGTHGGWISKAGHKLSFKNGKANCPQDGSQYILENEQVKII